MIVGSLEGCRSIAGSILKRQNKTSCTEKLRKGSVGDGLDSPTRAVLSNDYWRRLRNMPFTLATFRTIAKRMSIHSWIGRVISRASAQVFEPTVTEMPLYSNAGEDTGSHQAIGNDSNKPRLSCTNSLEVYHWRSSNVWENDMALTVTHFPEEKLTYAIFFGYCREREKKISTRLKKAGEDTAHPMVLPGILAELEHIRQMKAVEESIDDLEAQAFLLRNETVTTWQRSNSTAAERNRRKTKAWLDLTFARNLLVGFKSLLIRMLNHIDDVPLLDNHNRTQTYHRVNQLHNLREPAFRNAYQSGTSHVRGIGTIVRDESQSWHDGDSRYRGGVDTVTSHPERINESHRYQTSIQQAGIRMKDRLITLIDEYDDMIRDCTMRVDNMAMSTQWVLSVSSMAELQH